MMNNKDKRVSRNSLKATSHDRQYKTTIKIIYPFSKQQFNPRKISKIFAIFNKRNVGVKQL